MVICRAHSRFREPSQSSKGLVNLVSDGDFLMSGLFVASLAQYRLLRRPLRSLQV